MMNNNLYIILTVVGYWLLVYIRRVSEITCRLRNKCSEEPRHISEFFHISHVGSETLPGAPKDLFTALTCSQTYQNHSHGTPEPVITDPSYLMASQNAIQGCNALFKLTLRSLHSTSSQRLRDAPSNKKYILLTKFTWSSAPTASPNLSGHSLHVHLWVYLIVIFRCTSTCSQAPPAASSDILCVEGYVYRYINS